MRTMRREFFGRLARTAACLALLVPAAAWANTAPARMALVIGNGGYAGAHALANAGNDARLMAKTLTGLGYAVTERHDLDRAGLTDAVAQFAERLPQGAIALVYYAGHGMQIENNSYLTPVDMALSSPKAAQVQSYALKSMLERLARARSAVNVVVLDACRNNPFRPVDGQRYRSFRDLGLSPVEAPRGTFIAYSTAPGQLAPDGKNGNSLYTRTLAGVLREPGHGIEGVFKRVASLVRRESLDDQLPWYESSVAGNVVLGPGGAALAVAPVRSAPAVAGGNRQASRGMQAATDGETPWYREMGAADWSRLDWEIQQRVKHLTPDEIPGLKHKAGGGSVVAQTVLGLAYRDGLDRARDARSGKTLRFNANNTVAWSWLKKAAAAGFPVAQAEIGEMYYGAHGVARDLGASRRWLEQAAAANYPRAKLDLLQLNLESSGGKADPQDAVRSLFESLGIPKPGQAGGR